MPEKFGPSEEVKKRKEMEGEEGHKEKILSDELEKKGVPRDYRAVYTDKDILERLNERADRELPRPDYEGRPNVERVETPEEKILTPEEERDNTKESYKQRLHVALTLANTVAEAAGGWRQRVDTIKEMEKNAENANPETAIVIYKSLIDELESFISDYEMK